MDEPGLERDGTVYTIVGEDEGEYQEWKISDMLSQDGC